MRCTGRSRRATEHASLQVCDGLVTTPHQPGRPSADRPYGGRHVPPGHHRRARNSRLLLRARPTRPGGVGVAAGRRCHHPILERLGPLRGRPASRHRHRRRHGRAGGGGVRRHRPLRRHGRLLRRHGQHPDARRLRHLLPPPLRRLGARGGGRGRRRARSARSARRARDRPSNPTCTSACATPEAGTATAIRSACCPRSPPWEETRGRRRHRNPRRRRSRRSPHRRRRRAATVLRFVAPSPSGAACPRGGERRRVYATRAALPPRGRWPNRRLRPARTRRPGPIACPSRWRERRRDPRPGTLAGERKRSERPRAPFARAGPGLAPEAAALEPGERAPAGPRPGRAELRPQPGGPDWGLVLACLGLLGAAALLGLSEDGRAASRRTGRRAAGLLRPLMGRR